MASVEDLLDQVVRLQALQVRLGMPNQADAIVELGKAGISSTRIAELLGTTPGTVKVAIQRAKARAKTRKQSDDGGGNG